MRQYFSNEIANLFLGCLTILTLLSLTSCGKDDSTATGKNNRTGFYTYHTVNQYQAERCQIIGATPCGHTLDCGRYGRYYCQKVLGIE
jgi:hypothetical protein